MSRRATSFVISMIAGMLVSSAPSPAQHAPPRGVTLAPFFQLATLGGQRVAPEQIKRRPFVVFFGFTHCPDVCPTTLLVLSNLLEKLGKDGDKLGVYFVSVDPDRDTADHLKSYMTAFDPRISALTGSALDIAAVAHAFDAFYERVPGSLAKSYSFDHTTKIFLMDRYGMLAASIDPKEEPARTELLVRRILAQ